MREVYLVAECFELFMDQLIDREVEIHLDINPNEKHKSSSVVSQACGYVMGMTGIQPKIKDEAFAASHAADASCRGTNGFKTS